MIPAGTTDHELTWRVEVRPSDAERVRKLTAGVQVFSDAEVHMAGELVEERAAKGESCGYHFLFAEAGDDLLGYTCFGPIPCTAASFDLYWIVVGGHRLRRGVGTKLLLRSERLMQTMGARKIYAETSSLDRYGPARSFYQAGGYLPVTVLPDFYAPGDSKIIFVKDL